MRILGISVLIIAFLAALVQLGVIDVPKANMPCEIVAIAWGVCSLISFIAGFFIRQYKTSALICIIGGGLLFFGGVFIPTLIPPISMLKSKQVDEDIIPLKSALLGAASLSGKYNVGILKYSPDEKIVTLYTPDWEPRNKPYQYNGESWIPLWSPHEIEPN